MKIIRNGNLRLELVDTNLLFSLLFILFGGGLAYAVASKMPYHGWANLNAIAFIIFGSLLSLAGLLFARRVRFTFDQGQQQLLWTRTGILGSKSGTVPLSEIRWAFVQNDPEQFGAPTQGSGSYTRLTLALKNDLLPFSNAFDSNSAAKWARGRDAINDFLGCQPEDAPAWTPDDDIRRLVAAGQTIEAIKLVRERLDCSLAEAKQLIDDLKLS